MLIDVTRGRRSNAYTREPSGEAFTLRCRHCERRLCDALRWEGDFVELAGLTFEAPTYAARAAHCAADLTVPTAASLRCHCGAVHDFAYSNLCRWLDEHPEHTGAVDLPLT